MRGRPQFWVERGHLRRIGSAGRRFRLREIRRDRVWIVSQTRRHQARVVDYRDPPDHFVYRDLCPDGAVSRFTRRVNRLDLLG